MSPIFHRHLLRILQQQQSSFVLQRSESTLQRTDEALQLLNPKEVTLQALDEVRRITLVFSYIKKLEFQAV